MARILHRGVYQEVVVDDYFPCNESGNLLGALPAGGEEIWVMVLEKCWAKLFGSYEAIDGGLPNEVLRAFSAAPTYNFRMNSKKEDQDKLWEKILQADRLDYIICCGTEV
jgi:calpain-15